jgi:hypothetical protein
MYGRYRTERIGQRGGICHIGNDLIHPTRHSCAFRKDVIQSLNRQILCKNCIAEPNKTGNDPTANTPGRSAD